MELIVNGGWLEIVVTTWYLDYLPLSAGILDCGRDPARGARGTRFPYRAEEVVGFCRFGQEIMGLQRACLDKRSEAKELLPLHLHLRGTCVYTMLSSRVMLPGSTSTSTRQNIGSTGVTLATRERKNPAVIFCGTTPRGTLAGRLRLFSL